MKCLKCGYINYINKRFCYQCGFQLVAAEPTDKPNSKSLPEIKLNGLLTDTSGPAKAPETEPTPDMRPIQEPIHINEPYREEIIPTVKIEETIVTESPPDGLERISQNETVPTTDTEKDNPFLETGLEKTDDVKEVIPITPVSPNQSGVDRTVPERLQPRVMLRTVEAANLEKRLQILITGGYGFLGAAIADRCHQEGHRVFILDNLSTGNRKRISFRHVSYVRNIEDPECEEIFKNNHFDIVIHAASGDTPSSDINRAGSSSAGTHIAGLVNLLEFSSKFGVKKFILMSSEAVYGKSPETPYVEEMLSEPTCFLGVNKLTEEFYCRKWHETYGLPSVIFRTSQVYGPKESGVAQSPIMRALNTNALKIENVAIRSRDYIYIGDVVDAVYRSIYRKTSNILNLSTNTETSIEELADRLKEVCPLLEIVWEGERNSLNGSCRLDNTRARLELEWEPRYSLKDGIAKTLRWKQKHAHWSCEEVAATREMVQPKEQWPWLPYFENGLAFALVTVWSAVVKNNADYFMLDVKLIYIIMMGIMYGMVQSMIAVTLSIILYFVMALTLGNDIISLINHPISLTQIIIYIMVGLYSGYTTDRRNREIASQEIRLAELEEKNAFISELNHQNNLIQEELQNQIVNFEDSYGKIYYVTREIDSLEPENIFNASIGLMENVMKSNAVSLYWVDKTDQYLRLIAKSKQLEVPKSIVLNEAPDLAEIMVTKDIWDNRSFKPNLPILMAPILDGDKVVAIVALHHLQFEKYNMYYRNLFKVLVGFVSSALLRAYRFEEATSVGRCIDGTNVLNEESFKRILQLRMDGRLKNILQYSVLKIEGFDVQNESQLDKLMGLIREVDYLGHWNQNLYILLANTNWDEARNIVNRFHNNGLHATVISDEGELF